MPIDYASPGPLTGLGDVPVGALASIADDPVAICATVHRLVIEPVDASDLGLAEERLAEKQVRPAGELIRRLLALDPSPLAEGREPATRVVGTCRHFAVLSCALLRLRGIEARVRCGFATYFQPGRGLDHWITEYRADGAAGWTRVDSEVLGGSIVDRPEDLAPGLFLSGDEAWLAYRRGEIDASTFGVHGTANWGPAEVRGNVVKDLAALDKVEMLPGTSGDA